MDGPLTSLFAMLDPSDPTSIEQYIAGVTALTHHFGKASAAAAAQYYESERRAAGITGTFRAPLAPVAPVDKIDISTRWATKDLWKPHPDIETTKVKVTGVAEKNVLDTGRSTIIDAVHKDRKAIGWARVPEGTDPCSFCILLATRGAAYKTERAASFKSHDHCRCVPEAIFHAYEPSARIREWQSIYRDAARTAHGPVATRRAFRHALGQ